MFYKQSFLISTRNIVLNVDYEYIETNFFNLNVIIFFMNDHSDFSVHFVCLNVTDDQINTNSLSRNNIFLSEAFY